MPLSFSLPALDSGPDDGSPSRPATVARWLDETSRREAIDAARVMGSALAATNRVAMPDAHRLEIAEKYRTAAERLWPQLEAKFTRASQPLTGRALEAATSAIGLACELSVAYKRLLARQAGKRLVLGGTRRLVMLLQRSADASTRILVNSYLSYSPVPPRTWLDAHAIHAYSRERVGRGARDAPNATLERGYLQVLLLALANRTGFCGS
jgi:hypothetical protein